MKDKGIKLLALFEFSKGIIALLLVLGLLRYSTDDLLHLLIRLSSHLYNSHYFSDLLEKFFAGIHQSEFKFIFMTGVLYSIIRMAEGIGLYLEKNWARWLAIFSTLIYVPFEVYEIAHHATWIKVAVLFVNLGIVVYLYRFHHSRYRAKQRS
jgi:uncharacterized membrane protein (DUF2068 family)